MIYSAGALLIVLIDSAFSYSLSLELVVLNVFSAFLLANLEKVFFSYFVLNHIGFQRIMGPPRFLQAII
jgi:hypothetical protein